MSEIYVPHYSDREFRVLCADPPWAFDDPLPGERGAVHKYKSVMTFEEIVAYPLPRMMRHSHLLLWRVSAMVEEAYAVVRAWGFEPKAELVWEKETKHGKDAFGNGRTVRNAHESCIIATRGRPVIKRANVRSTFRAKVGAHSAKPPEFYAIVERLFFGPYVELFARRHQGPGWSCFGNELPRQRRTHG